MNGRVAVSWLGLCFALSAASDPPVLSVEGVVNAAGLSAGGVAPGEIIVLFPSNAGPEVLAGAQINSDGKVPTLLGETRVWFDDIAAPISYSVKGQIGAVVPYEIANRKTTQVTVEYQGVRSAPVTLPVIDTTPALFTLDSSGKGQAGMLNETGCCNSARNPAARGSLVALYATGAGQTTPPGISGSISTQTRIADFPAPQSPVRVTVGGEPAEIVYAAAAPHMVSGMLQVNVRVPAKAPLGDAVPVVLTVGDSHSPEGVTMAVRSAVQQVLVIDPEADGRTRLRKLLTEAGYEVQTAGSGPEALGRASGHSIDLVILRLGMPEEEQRNIVAALRAERPRLKIAVTAGTLDAPTLRSADVLGAQVVLTKPMTPNLVLRRVRELLRSRPVPYVAGEQAPTIFLKRGVGR